MTYHRTVEFRDAVDVMITWKASQIYDKLMALSVVNECTDMVPTISFDSDDSLEGYETIQSIMDIADDCGLYLFRIRANKLEEVTNTGSGKFVVMCDL